MAASNSPAPFSSHLSPRVLRPELLLSPPPSQRALNGGRLAAADLQDASGMDLSKLQRQGSHDGTATPASSVGELATEMAEVGLGGAGGSGEAACVSVDAPLAGAPPAPKPRRVPTEEEEDEMDFVVGPDGHFKLVSRAERERQAKERAQRLQQHLQGDAAGHAALPARLPQGGPPRTDRTTAIGGPDGFCNRTTPLFNGRH